MIKFSQIFKEFNKTFKNDKLFEVISFVGSAATKINYNDIDIIFICKNKNSPQIINKTINKIKKINFKKYKKNIKVLVNRDFGPIKLNQNKYNLVFHTMFYDINSHKNHVIQSPFTCYDWERSEINLKKKIKNIYPVKFLMISDFLNSNRNLLEFKSSIMQGKISCSKYVFYKDKILTKKYKKKLDNYNYKIFCKNVIYHSVRNFLKFNKQKNIFFSDRQVANFIKRELKIFDFSEQIFNQELKIIKQFTMQFLNQMQKYIKNIIKDSKKIYFIRHFKTKYKKSIFLGQFLNPPIMKLQKQKLNYRKNQVCVYSSPLKRALQTSKFFFKNKSILKSNLLREIDYGKIEGLDLHQVKDLYPNTFKEMKNNSLKKYPCGESIVNFFKRIQKFKNLIMENKKKYIYIFSHNNFIRAILSEHFSIERSKIYQINIRYGERIDFIQYRNTLIPNFQRTKLTKLINYKK